MEFPTVQLVSAFAAAILGLGLHQAAYSAEIIRGGLVSVDPGQHEAAAALGIPASRRLFRIILPQAMRSIVPNATNEIIGLVKGASVVFVIAIPELFYAVQVIYNRNSRVIPLLLGRGGLVHAHHDDPEHRAVLHRAVTTPAGRLARSPRRRRSEPVRG